MTNPVKGLMDMKGIPQSHPTRRIEECTAQLRSGRFCSSPTLPDAPFPICVHHATRLYEFVKHSIRAAEDETDYEVLSAIMAPGANAREIAGRDEAPSVVYYLRVGPLIKIGRTRNLTYRLNAYPPGTVLLATEPGDADLESVRLAQFRTDLAERAEWFRPSAALVLHINTLRQTPLTAADFAA